MLTRTLLLGGARSGKSSYAEALLAGEAVDYLATARRDPTDREWEERIAGHIARRPPTWRTVEPADLPAELRAPRRRSILVDDLGVWLTGELDDAGAWTNAEQAVPWVRGRTAELVAAVTRCPVRLVLVSPEVGSGVVPQTRAGRLFRDELGALNAAIAAASDEVLLVVAGLPVRLR
ncbi:MAG TPA: bifunctional adenosylcobinamide kinase/adenosylcobinamide-phosphate guanylyltransferase [Pseudonocardiaceae bacterium]|nr:bifunctional adenosylcobinamide kinase/adenosylcobinamide-phosphate guanylyltransferase [Pseudonocardiaceae bacterium]